jgi:hypothetical protein
MADATVEAPTNDGNARNMSLTDESLVHLRQIKRLHEQRKSVSSELYATNTTAARSGSSHSLRPGTSGGARPKSAKKRMSTSDATSPTFSFPQGERSFSFIDPNTDVAKDARLCTASAKFDASATGNMEEEDIQLLDELLDTVPNLQRRLKVELRKRQVAALSLNDALRVSERA